MKKLSKSLDVLVSCAAIAATLMMTGCSELQGTAAPSVRIAGISGNVHGGQQPISGAAIHLYTANVYSGNATNYTGTNVDMLTTTVTTNSSGGFNFTGDYTCSTGDQMYLVAVGGNPGVGQANPQAVLMAALGDCSTLTSTRFINLNEVTTVATAVALSPFMTSYTSIGAPASNKAGLVRAFNNVNKLVNTSSGYAGGPTLPANATAPIAELYTLANVLSACVNSVGGTAGDNTACGKLFTYATASGATSPTETAGLALAIAKNPTLNVTNIYNYEPAVSPFSPQLSSAPNDWTMSINYTGFNAPKTTSVDAGGNVWVANSGSNTVSIVSQSGVTTATYSDLSLMTPTAIALDASGNAWIANLGGSTVTALSAGGTPLANSPYTVGTSPAALSFDSTGKLWVANSGSANVTELSSSGGTLATVASAGTPAAIVVNAR